MGRQRRGKFRLQRSHILLFIGLSSFFAFPFGLPVVWDMRLKAFRKWEQLVEYLVMLSAKHDLN